MQAYFVAFKKIFPNLFICIVNILFLLIKNKWLTIIKQNLYNTSLKHLYLLLNRTLNGLLTANVYNVVVNQANEVDNIRNLNFYILLQPGRRQENLTSTLSTDIQHCLHVGMLATLVYQVDRL